MPVIIAAAGEGPKDTPEQPLPEPPWPFPATDLRTGTEVDPAVVNHHAAFLQGEDYSNPYEETK